MQGGMTIETNITPEDEINLLELLQILVRRKKLIIRMTLGSALATAAIALVMPNIYTATARVLPPQKESGGGLSSLLSGSAGALAGMAGLGGMGGSGDLYVGMLKSRSVEDAVIRRLGLNTVYKSKTPEDSRTTLEKKVKIQLGAKDGIITIDADDKEPKRAALIATTFVEELGKTTVRLNLNKAGTERLFLEKRLLLVKSDLRRAEDELRTFAQANKTIHVDSQAKASIESIAKLKAELASKEVQLAALHSYQTDENQEVKTLQSAISGLHREISIYSGGSGSGEGIPSVGSAPSLGLQFARLMREVKTQEAIYEQLTKQYEVAKLSEAKDSSLFQVLDEAVVPTKKASPKRALMVILAGFTAFFISAFIAFIQEYGAKMSEEDRRSWQEIRKGLTIPLKSRAE
jgi:tyrosine-protein kinase Etk/Wzc